MNRQEAYNRVVEVTKRLLYLPVQSLEVLDNIRMRTVAKDRRGRVELLGNISLSDISSDLLLTGTQVGLTLMQLRESKLITEINELTKDGVDACHILPVIMRIIDKD